MNTTAHPSARLSAVQNYNRLEFLGDAVLDFCVARELFRLHPTASPALLTAGKSSLVSTQTLARVCEKSGLLPHIVAEHLPHVEAPGMQEVEDEISHFGLWLGEAAKYKADVVEAVIGAYFVDCGFDVERCWLFVQKHFLSQVNHCLFIIPDEFIFIFYFYFFC